MLGFFWIEIGYLRLEGWFVEASDEKGAENGFWGFNFIEDALVGPFEKDRLLVFDGTMIILN